MVWETIWRAVTFFQHMTTALERIEQSVRWRHGSGVRELWGRGCFLDAPFGGHIFLGRLFLFMT